MPVIGWKLDRQDREALLGRVRPRWPNVFADHVTLDAHAKRGDRLPPDVRAEVVGEADDGKGLQAVVVAIDGSTDRPDGSVYHITWSLDRAAGRKPVESNTLLAQKAWQPIDPPIPIRLTPARLN
ncbi:hypothetical protein [Parafrankia sp. BMG5.11]|uniref:hypothetical protein n=1 Tax=Parafrankia sp. BMG5.11 TaxID=222540 RepID=UPI001039D266|nr:hypothetical protein [Parafrankia sp. BMG5.11]TCJ38391.1 hypothetical protein E0504_15695 [Parafrankia sp. BMG5.11]